MKKGQKKQRIVKFTNRLREFREKAYLTQDELGAEVGLSGDAIGNIENDRNTPRVTTMRKLAAFFNVPISELFPPVQKTESKEESADGSTFNPAA